MRKKRQRLQDGLRNERAIDRVGVMARQPPFSPTRNACASAGIPCTALVLDPRSGSVSYAVVSVGGFLGIGEKLVAVPWQALQTDTGRKAFVMDATKDKLKQAEGFDEKNWPNMADAKWNADAHGFYGQPLRDETGARGATSDRGAGGGGRSAPSSR